MTSGSPDTLSQIELRDLRLEIAKGKIRDVVYRYCRGVDRADEALIASAFHDWAYEQHGAEGGSAKAFARATAEVVPGKLLDVQHMVGNILIEIDGDVAHVESYVIATQRRTADPSVVGVFGGRYLDRFECHAGDWRIARRTVVNDWTWRTAMPTDAMTENMFPRGRNDGGDIGGLADTWAPRCCDIAMENQAGAEKAI